MSHHEPSKTPTAIKIAAKEASQRNSAGGAADPGPGDPNAEPSTAPQLVDLPDPPTPSQLVIKSTPSGKAVSNMANVTSNTALKKSSSSSKRVSSHGQPHHSKHSNIENSITGSQAGPAASQPSTGAPREPTSSRALTGAPAMEGRSVAGSALSKPKSATTVGGSQGGKSKTNLEVGSNKSAVTSAGSPVTSPMNVDGKSEGGVVHDETEEGEGEVESPITSPGSPASPARPPMNGLRGSSQTSADMTAIKDSGGIDNTPASSGAGASKMSTKTSKKSHEASNKGMSGYSPSTALTSGKGKKKVTKFRYHKRITVRTTGKTNPTSIMSKVNQKDHKAGITPSTIEDMDPQELMKRAGIKGSNQTHWRVRLRQTKRLTKGGKTTTETKVAYRDSEGNKRIKTSATPDCQKCGKKLEECHCDSPSRGGE